LRGDQLEGDLETARREAAAHLDTAQRLQADFDNYRKRVAREQEEASTRSARQLVLNLLPVVDNLERALAHAPEDDPLGEGVRMVLQQVYDVFEKQGIERIDALDQPFDPNEHQAVGRAERPDVPEDTCVAVYQPGYRMQGKVLRSASVVVSCGGPARQE
jgi:molecular chaperone GrpE